MIVANYMSYERQLVCHRPADTTFYETKPYGYLPNVYLMWRRRVPEFQLRDKQGRIHTKTKARNHVGDSPGYYYVRPVGWTARLRSNAPSLDGAGASAAICTWMDIPLSTHVYD